MKTKRILSFLIPAGIVLSAIFILAGCASKKNIWGDTKKGLIMSYRMPEGKTLNYLTMADVTQKMSVMGQDIEVLMNSYQEYSFNCTNPVEDPLSLSITVDTMSLYLKTPMKDLSPDMASVMGKEFDIRLSRLGVESHFEGAEAITYDMAGETRNLGPEMQGFFVNFPDHPVKPGESWSYSDTIREESSGNWLHIMIINTATLEGYEVMEGKDCARITIAGSGTILGEGNIQGIDTKTTGEISGTETCWFAYKEGVMVKYISEGLAPSETKTSGEREMTIPATREFLKEVLLTD